MVPWVSEGEQENKRDERKRGNVGKKRGLWKSLKKLTYQVYLKRGQKARDRNKILIAYYIRWPSFHASSLLLFSLDGYAVTCYSRA